VLTVVDGKEIRLKDLWPERRGDRRHRQGQREAGALPPGVRADVRDTARHAARRWRRCTTGALQSTYIRRPPYWEGALAGPRTLKGMRPLAILPDNITTDHLSPSNAIMLDSAAGEYLARMGLPEEDFNSYATHRGDHLTAHARHLRQPQLKSTRWPWSTARCAKGSLARVEPEGKVMRMWEAIETYIDRRQPLIIVAGADYGQGSSRDWAAKGVRLAGVEAIVAEGFERIHRTNLIGMGVLPLEFKPGVTGSRWAWTAPRPTT
jgi:aconitase A